MIIVVRCKKDNIVVPVAAIGCYTVLSMLPITSPCVYVSQIVELLKKVIKSHLQKIWVMQVKKNSKIFIIILCVIHVIFTRWLIHLLALFDLVTFFKLKATLYLAFCPWYSLALCFLAIGEECVRIFLKIIFWPKPRI